ncbi:MAG: phytanoyl-CoA dioxygenase family protein [Pseudomonadota bacterium]
MLGRAKFTKDYLSQFEEQGFAVVRGVFGPTDIAELSAACDRVEAEGLKHDTSFRHKNLFYRIGQDAKLGKVLRMAQWPSYEEAVLERFRRDPRLLEILSPLLGTDLKQIINQVHWKHGGAEKAEFGYHQDIRFRRPRAAYRNTRRSYLQTGIAIDPQNADNGALRLYPGSHRLGELQLGGRGPVMESSLTDQDLLSHGLDPKNIVTLELEPGDVAFWGLYTIHGSGPNHSGRDLRRFYLNSYVRAEDCDRGEWTFRGGEPCPLGDAVLVHYEELYSRPEPHYLSS